MAAAKSAAKIAERYARDVVNAKIVAGKDARLACQRQLEDLDSARKRGFKFDARKAQHVVDFIQGACRHAEGNKWAGKLIELTPAQTFSTAVRYGWVREDGTRRFRRSYEEEARKNGKTTRKAAEALYALVGDGEAGAKVYPFATTYAQASILFETAKRMVEQEARLLRKVIPFSHNLAYRATGSLMMPLHSKSRTQDGWNVHMGIADEFHAHPNSGMWDIIDSSTGAREQPFIQAITTAGANLAGPAYKRRDYIRKVLDGTLQDDEWFGIIYTVDDEEAWNDPTEWAKANPNLGVAPTLEYLQGKAKSAQAVHSDLITFKTKHLNIWVGAMNAFFDLAAWKKLGDPKLRMEDFKGQPCWLSIDAGLVRDPTAMVAVFERDGHYYEFPQIFLPAERVLEKQSTETQHYAAWAAQGHVILTPGPVADFDLLEENIREFAKVYSPQAICFDKYKMPQLESHLMQENLPMVEIPQQVKYMSPAMKHTEKLIAQKRLHNNGNPCMNWMVANVVGKVDRKDNIYPNKEFEANKIDGPVALIMLMSRVMLGGDGPKKSIYEERGIISL